MLPAIWPRIYNIYTYIFFSLMFKNVNIEMYITVMFVICMGVKPGLLH
jgi:hypothetical protein